MLQPANCFGGPGLQRNASPYTIAGYRDTWRLLVTFAATRTGIPPSCWTPMTSMPPVERQSF